MAGVEDVPALAHGDAPVEPYLTGELVCRHRRAADAHTIDPLGVTMSRSVLRTLATARLAWSVLCLTLLAACVLGAPGLVADAAAATKGLDGRLWTATYIKGVGHVAPSAPTAMFAGPAVTGSGGVNFYTAACRTSKKGVIHVTNLVSTKIAGSPKAEAQESAFFKGLEKAAKYKVSGDTLELRGGGGALLVRFTAKHPSELTGRMWSADGVTDGNGGLKTLVPDSRITLEFLAGGKLGGNAGVNLYGASYTTGDAGAITIGPEIVATAMSGAADVMAQEEAYLDALPRAATWAIQDGVLWLRDAGGAPLARFTAP